MWASWRCRPALGALDRPTDRPGDRAAARYPRRARRGLSGVTPMALKDLLVYLDQSPAPASPLQAALILAQRLDAHLTALHLIAEPFLRGMVGHHLPAEVMREHLAHAEAEAEGILASARAAAGRHGVDLDAVRESGSLDKLPTLLARRARCTDLTVIGQPDPETGGVDDMALTEAAFMDSGHPALVIPRGWSGTL